MLKTSKLQQFNDCWTATFLIRKHCWIRKKRETHWIWFIYRFATFHNKHWGLKQSK